jgi:hypothetical protein
VLTVERANACPLVVVIAVVLVFARAATACGGSPPSPEAPAPPAAIASASNAPLVPPAPASVYPPPAASSARAAVDASPSASASPGAKASAGATCLARGHLAADARQRLVKLVDDLPPDDAARRKLEESALPDIDDDGQPDLVLADAFGGTYNRASFVYVSGHGCWSLAHASIADFFVVLPLRRHDGRHDLVEVTKTSSCTDPNDVFSFRRTTLEWTGMRYRASKPLSCRCPLSPKAMVDERCALARP